VSKQATAEVELDSPIKREGDDVTVITLRKPMAGELRGLSLADLLNLEVDAITRVLPRISTPVLSEQEARNMDPADLVACGGEISSFLLPKRLKG